MQISRDIGPFALMQDFFSVKFLPVLLQGKNPVASSKAVGPAWLLRWRAGAGRLIEYRGRCCAYFRLIRAPPGECFTSYVTGFFFLVSLVPLNLGH